MVSLTVLIPARDPGEELARQLPEVIRIASGLAETFEIIGIDDGSRFEPLQLWRLLLTQHPQLRVVRLEKPLGLSAALAAGIAASRGASIVAIEPGPRYVPEQMAVLLERLARADLVHGRRRRSHIGRFCQAFVMWPRRMLLGLEARDPDCLFWAVRREAILGVELGHGLHRFLPSLVGMRGYRTCEITVDHRPARCPSGQRGIPSLANLLAVWWLRRQVQHPQATEMARFDSRIDGRQLRIDPARRPTQRARNDVEAGNEP